LQGKPLERLVDRSFDLAARKEEEKRKDTLWKKVGTCFSPEELNVENSLLPPLFLFFSAARTTTTTGH
jgi:hypothetical protein